MYSSKRLWLTADGKRVVGDGDPEASQLLVGEGGTIAADELERRGLSAADVREALKDDEPAKSAESAPDRDEAEAAVKAKSAPAETKHRRGPDETK